LQQEPACRDEREQHLGLDVLGPLHVRDEIKGDQRHAGLAEDFAPALQRPADRLFPIGGFQRRAGWGRQGVAEEDDAAHLPMGAPYR